jgi:ribosome-associated translation inhibitor RaiA
MRQMVKRASAKAAGPKARPRTSGRTSVAETPLAVRTSGIDVDRDLRGYIHGRLGWRLGKFARHIERLTVRFEDVNGPKGGVDTVCRIKVVFAGLPTVIVEELGDDAFAAFNRADDRVERAVRHAVGRRQAPARRPPARRGASPKARARA